MPPRNLECDVLISQTAALQDDGEEEEEEEGCPSEFTADCAAAALPLPHVHAQLLWSSRRRPDGLSLPLRVRVFF